MTPLELDQAREAVWQALGDRPMRRRLLGRKRSDAIVRVALSQIAAKAGQLAVEVAGKFLRDKLGADDQARLVRDSVASLSSRPSVN